MRAVVATCKACSRKSSQSLNFSRVIQQQTIRSYSSLNDEFKIERSSFKPEDAKKIFDFVYDGNWNGLAELKKEREGKKMLGNEALVLAEAGDYKGLISLKQRYDADSTALEVDDVAKIIVAFGKVGSIPDAEVVYEQYLKTKANTDRQVVSLRNALLQVYLANGEEEKAQNFFINYPVTPSVVSYGLLSQHSWKTEPTKLYAHLNRVIGVKE